MKSVVTKSNFSFISQGLGMKDVSVSANATLYSLSRSANRLSSHGLLRISTTNRQVGKFFARFRKKRKRRENSSACISYLPNRGNCNSSGPNFSFSKSIRSMNESNSASQSTNIFVCVTTCGTFRAKRKSGGVFSYQPVTVEGFGVP